MWTTMSMLLIQTEELMSLNLFINELESVAEPSVRAAITHAAPDWMLLTC